MILEMSKAYFVTSPAEGYAIIQKDESKANTIYRHWPNISANDPDPGSGSKKLNLNRDHF